MEDVVIFYVQLAYFSAIWCILLPWRIVSGYWVNFSVLVRCSKKNLATLAGLHALT
jgi:hypothetical protein